MGALLDVLGWILPPRCWICGGGVVAGGASPALDGPPACAAHALRPGLAGARCGVCAGPLPDGIWHGLRCGDCRRRGRPFSRTVAALDYQDAAARAWILAFKHGGRADLAAPLARILADAVAADSSADATKPADGGLGLRDRLVPVPLHPARRLDRGHDQAALLARELARLTGAGVAEVLRRVRATAAQGDAVAPARDANVRRAFRARGPRFPRAARIWLVDDVMTSGATAAECARALKRAGAAEVRVLVLARARAGGMERAPSTDPR